MAYASHMHNPYEDPNYDPKATTDENGKPIKPKERRYGSLTGAEFFSDQYKTPEYQQYWDPFSSYDQGSFGTEFAGTPVVRGYWETGEDGVEGGFTPEQSLYETASSLYDLRNTEVPDFQDWVQSGNKGYINDIYGTEEWKGLQETIGSFFDTDSDMVAIREQQALAAGFITPEGTGDIEAYNNWLASTGQELNQGVAGQTGVLGTELENTYRRAQSGRIQQVIDSNAQMLEAMGQSSNAAAYSKMSEVSNQIANESLQFEVKLAEQDLIWKQTEYNALVQRRDSIISQANDGGRMYAEMLMNNRMGALQGYATALNTMLASNQGIRDEYGKDLEAISLHADITYKSIMTDMGYDEHQMNMAESKYNEFMAPYWENLEVWYQDQAIIDAQKDRDIEYELGGFVQDPTTGEWGLPDDYVSPEEKASKDATRNAVLGSILSIIGSIIVGLLSGGGK